MATALQDCRICLEKKKNVISITSEIISVYNQVTGMKLAKLYSFSNSVCLLCYKKLLAAQSYREMLIQIEQKLLATFNHTQTKFLQSQQSQQSQPSVNKAIRSNGAPRTPIVTPKAEPTRQFARHQMQTRMQEQTAMDEDEDMSLLDEIVSFDGPSMDNDNHHFSFLNEDDDELKAELIEDDEEEERVKVKDEPEDLLVVSESQSSNGFTPNFTNTLQNAHQHKPNKPYKCTYPGCSQSSTTRTALQKHRRRVHGICMRFSANGGKITRSKPSSLYNQLELSVNEFKCKFCTLKLRNRRVLLRHIETVHMQAKFYCTVMGCSHASTRKDNYRLHLKNHHRDLPEEELERVLNETRNMKPIYANQLDDLQLKIDEMEKLKRDGGVDDGVAEIPGYSFVNINIDEAAYEQNL